MRIRGFAPSTPCWAELTSADPARAARFYCALFNWELDGDRFLLDGHVVAGLDPVPADRSEGWITYLATDDIGRRVERIGSAYGRCLSSPAPRAGARAATVADPTGAVFGLWQAAGFAGMQVRGDPG